MHQKIIDLINNFTTIIQVDIFNLRKIVRQALEEDIQTGDLTCLAVIDDNIQGSAKIIAKESGVIAGIAPTVLSFLDLDENLELVSFKSDGDFVQKGTIILEIHSKASALLSAERTALNFLGHLSGIATLAHKFVETVKEFKVQLLDTRKTAPGLRLLEKFAILAGGMKNHRFGLSDQILLKENHLRASGLKIGEAIKRCKQKFSYAIIGAEAETLDEFIEAMNAEANYVLLDEFSFEDIIKAVEIRNNWASKTGKKIELEVSGGVTLESVRKFAETGIDRISIGAVTHSAKRFDLTCLLDFNTQQNEK